MDHNRVAPFVAAEPEATDLSLSRELSDFRDVEARMNDGGHCMAVTDGDVEDYDAMTAQHLSERLNALADRLDAHCRSVDALVTDLTDHIKPSVSFLMGEVKV